MEMITRRSRGEPRSRDDPNRCRALAFCSNLVLLLILAVAVLALRQDPNDANQKANQKAIQTMQSMEEYTSLNNLTMLTKAQKDFVKETNRKTDNAVKLPSADMFTETYLQKCGQNQSKHGYRIDDGSGKGKGKQFVSLYWSDAKNNEQQLGLKLVRMMKAAGKGGGPVSDPLTAQEMKDIQWITAVCESHQDTFTPKYKFLFDNINLVRRGYGERFFLDFSKMMSFNKMTWENFLLQRQVPYSTWITVHTCNFFGEDKPEMAVKIGTVAFAGWQKTPAQGRYFKDDGAQLKYQVLGEILRGVGSVYLLCPGPIRVRIALGTDYKLLAYGNEFHNRFRQERFNASANQVLENCLRSEFPPLAMEIAPPDNVKWCDGVEIFCEEADNRNDLWFCNRERTLR